MRRAQTVIAGMEEGGRDHKSQNVGSLKNLEEAGNRFCPSASRKSTVLQLPSLETSETDFRPLYFDTEQKLYFEI